MYVSCCCLSLADDVVVRSAHDLPPAGADEAGHQEHAVAPGLHAAAMPRVRGEAPPPTALLTPLSLNFALLVPVIQASDL